jgi:hypothetical protein
MATSFELLDELEQSFDDAYEGLDITLDDLLSETCSSELKNNRLLSMVEKSKEKLKQIGYVWSRLMENSQSMYAKQEISQVEISSLKLTVLESSSRNEEFEKLIQILDAVNLQTERLKNSLSKKSEDQTKVQINKDSTCVNQNRNENLSQNLVKELINEQYDNSMDSKEQCQNEITCSNNAPNDINNQFHEDQNLNENYEFKGTTQMIPCGPVNRDLLDPRLKVRFISMQKNIQSKLFFTHQNFNQLIVKNIFKLS